MKAVSEYSLLIDFDSRIYFLPPEHDDFFVMSRLLGSKYSFDMVQVEKMKINFNTEIGILNPQDDDWPEYSFWSNRQSSWRFISTTLTIPNISPLWLWYLVLDAAFAMNINDQNISGLM